MTNNQAPMSKGTQQSESFGFTKLNEWGIIYQNIKRRLRNGRKERISVYGYYRTLW